MVLRVMQLCRSDVIRRQREVKCCSRSSQVTKTRTRLRTDLNLIMLLFIWFTCLHWQLITNRLFFKSDKHQLTTVGPFLKHLKNVQNSRSKVITQQLFWLQVSHFDTKGVLCSVKILPPFFLLINVDRAGVPHSASSAQPCHLLVTMARSTPVTHRLISFVSVTSAKNLDFILKYWQTSCWHQLQNFALTSTLFLQISTLFFKLEKTHSRLNLVLYLAAAFYSEAVLHH